ncbi:MAG: helix-turn-helix domain-containing protein [Clostridia bacterium]|nr:helix-turn-helix domain-containing protein [Clostridia bacterium]
MILCFKEMNAVFDKKSNKFCLTGDCAVHCVSTDLACEEHTHEYIELVYCFSGTALNYVNGEPYVLTKGDLLLINQNAVHSFYPKPRAKYCDIMVKPSFFDKKLEAAEGIHTLLALEEFSQFADKLKNEKIFVHFSAEDQKKVEFLINATEDEQKAGATANLPMRRSALCMLFTLVFRSMSCEQGMKINAELLSHIRTHCTERIMASTYAQKCFYTNEHFSRKFKALVGKTFTRYVVDCRLEKAAELLLCSHKTVDVVLVESGFSSRGEFFQKFEQRYGETPLQFRKNQKSVQNKAIICN